MIILTRGTTNRYLAEERIGFHKLIIQGGLTGYLLPEGKVKAGPHLMKLFNCFAVSAGTFGTEATFFLRLRLCLPKGSERIKEGTGGNGGAGNVSGVVAADVEGDALPWGGDDEQMDGTVAA